MIPSSLSLLILSPLCPFLSSLPGGTRPQHYGPSLGSHVHLVKSRVGVGTDDTSNGHEETKCRSRTQHVLAESSHDAIGTGSIAEDINGSKNKSHNNAHSSTHHSTHLELVDVGGTMLAGNVRNGRHCGERMRCRSNTPVSTPSIRYRFGSES